jgi:hypothetical protein
MSTKIVCKDNFKYEVHERQSAANAALDARQGSILQNSVSAENLTE